MCHVSCALSLHKKPKDRASLEMLKQHEWIERLASVKYSMADWVKGTLSKERLKEIEEESEDLSEDFEEAVRVFT